MKHDDDRYAGLIADRLHAADEALDEDLTQRLAEARRTALRQMPAAGGRKPRQWFVPAMAMASVMALVIGVAVWRSAPLVPAAGVDVLDIVASTDGLDLYEEIEFYQWLAEQQARAG